MFVSFLSENLVISHLEIHLPNNLVSIKSQEPSSDMVVGLKFELTNQNSASGKKFGLVSFEE